MIDLRAIAAYYGGAINGSSVSIPTPGHSRGDKGTHITVDPDAPDGCLVHCFNGSANDALAVKDMLRRDGFLPERQSVARKSATSSVPEVSSLIGDHAHQGAKADDFTLMSQWEYHDANGSVLYRKKRIDRADGTKSFFFEHPDGFGGWIKGQGDQSHVPYRLPALVQSDGIIFAAEGERCADRLVQWGLNATSSKDIERANLDFLQGRTVVILPDNDEPGRKCAAKAFDAVKTAGGTPQIVGLPGLPERGDIIDWSGTRDDLIALVRATVSKETMPKKPWLIPADELLCQPSPPRWIVRDLFEEGAFGMIHGPSGSGKSFVMIDIAMHISCAQQDWHGSLVGKHGPIVYLAGEGHYGMRRRLAAWVRHYGKEPRLAKLHVSQSGCDLDQSDGYQQTVEAIRALPEQPILIIVDTLHRFLSGDENSAKDARAMISACDRLREEFGCALVLVHHTGVNSEVQHRARGSSAWKGAVDFEFSVEAKNHTITLSSRKAKDGPEAAPRHFALHDVMLNDWLDEDGKPTSSVVILPTEPVKAERKDQRLAEYLKWFEEAWLNSEREVIDARPYLSRVAVLDYLQTHHNFAKRTAENQVAPSRKGCFANTLTGSGQAEVSEQGWTLVDPVLALSLKLKSDSRPPTPSGTLASALVV